MTIPSLQFVLPPARGNPFPLLLVLIPLAMLSLLAAPFFYYTKNKTLRKFGGIFYHWFGLINFCAGLGLILFPIFFIGIFIYQRLSGAREWLSFRETIFWLAVWLAIPGVPLLFGYLLLRFSAAIATDKKILAKDDASSAIETQSGVSKN